MSKLLLLASFLFSAQLLPMARNWLATFMSTLQAYPELLLSIACFIFFFLYHGARRSSVRTPINWPIVGMLPGLLANLHRVHDWATGILANSGCTFIFHGPWFSGMDFLITADPAIVNHILNVNFSNYPKGDEFSEIFDILGDGIFNADAESWKSQRLKAQSLMVDRGFRSFVSNSSRDKVEMGLLSVLSQIAEREDVVDLQDVFLRLTFDLTSKLVFGVDPGCLATEFRTVPFAKAMDDAMGVLFLRHSVPSQWWKLKRYLNLGEEKKLVMAWEVIDGFVDEITSKRREKSNEISVGHEEVVKPADLLTSYIEDSKVNQHSFDDKFLRDTMVNLMLAGRDTTGVALGWFFWLLAENPKVEARIHEELKACSPRKKGLVVFDSKEVGKLVYLHASLCECLRLFPPVPFEHKSVLKTEVLPSGLVAQRGMKILISLYSMGRMEGVWGKDCTEFKPERWISENGKLRHEPSYKFLSFNSGPRTCLGRDIAFTQMKAVVAAMVYNFHVEVVKGHVVEPKLSIILHMKNGLKVRIRKRAS